VKEETCHLKEASKTGKAPCKTKRLVGRRGNPGGSAAELRGGYAVLDGEQSEKRVAQYAAPHAGQSAPDGRSPEQREL